MIRVTHSMMYSSMVQYMNSNLGQLVDLNLQSSSQKKINKPSDDASGTYQVLDHRTTLGAIDQYNTNVDTATGWLEQADDTMLQVNDILTRLKELAEQGATGTVSADNREQISYEARELYEQLINLTNVRFDGKSVFAGHQVENSAFTKSQWMMDNDGTLSAAQSPPAPANTPLNFNLSGGGDDTILLQFTSPWFPGGIGTTYQYTNDGGNTWQNGAVGIDGVTGEYLLDMGSTQLRIDSATPPDPAAITPVASPTDSNGTWWTVYPTAQYNGDDNDAIDVVEFGAANVTGVAAGKFPNNVMVRVDNYDGAAQEITYSTSTDGGLNWKTNNVAPASPVDTSALLSVPGGTLTLNMATNVGTDLAAGQQFSIHPRTADIALEISPDESMIVNGVGKDIFGGIYQDPSNTNPSLVFASDPSKNMFDTIGRLVASLELNSQQGCGVALEDLRTSSEHLLNQVASVAGRENRLTVVSSILEGMELNETARLSSVEDVDVTELMSNLSQQQIAYQAVLQSSSQIMNMSLLNYI